MSEASAIITEQIVPVIRTIREQKVMMDFDLAKLYGVTTGRLNEQVRRNIERFPKDFSFQLTREEFKILMSQIAISNMGSGGRRKLPLAFTEHGILMLSSVLHSKRAVQVNIAIMRTFVTMRKMLFSYADLCRRIDALEARYDEQFRIIFDAIRTLMRPEPPPAEKQRIGFRLD